MAPEASARKAWPSLVLAVAFLAAAGCSVYLGVRLLTARCEGFSCTYLGIAWLVWLAVVCLPATVLGYFAQKSVSLAAGLSRALRAAWLAHSMFALGLLAWWIFQP